MKEKQLLCQNREDWDDVKVWSPVRHKAVPALRINVDQMDKANQQLLAEELKLMRISYNVRRATTESKHIHIGDKTVRISGEANIEKLSKLFGDKSDTQTDWRNLKNWDDKEFYHGGIIPVMGKCLNLKDKTPDQIQHIRDVFDDLDIKYGIRSASKATSRIAQGDQYLRITDSEDLQKLAEFTDLWTPQETMPRIPVKDKGGR